MLLFFLVNIFVLGQCHGKSTTLRKSSDVIILENGYVSATIDVKGGAWISSLSGDFSGNGVFKTNLLAESGIRLERENTDGTVRTLYH